MELMIMLMIVGLFGVWIYGLKQEIATLEKRLPSEQLEADRVAPAPQTVSANTSGARNSVQTWVLE